MSRQAWERIGGTSGVLFAISLAIGILAGGAPPDFGTEPKELVTYYADHKSALQGTYLLGAGVPVVFGSWFFGTLTVALWRAPGEARFGALIGGLSAAVLAASATAVALMSATLIYDASVIGGDDPLVQAIYDATLVGGWLITFIEGVVPIAFGLASLRLGAAWRWTGYAGILVGLVNFAVGIVAFTVTLNLGVGGLLGIGTFLVWALAVSIMLLWKGVSEPAVVEAGGGGGGS